MVTRRTVDLLPEIFRTDTNKKFLSATLDQLTQEPNFIRTQGYVGRRVGPGVNPADNYVQESTAERTDYQLEPGVCFLRPNTGTVTDAVTYPGLIDTLSVQGANVEKQDRLWQSDYYAWDPFVDFDKFTNYSQYYWLPSGPLPVDVFATEIPLTDSFDVTRNRNTYTFSGVAGENPTITLARGGNYTFNVNQVGHRFWIQTDPGVDGRLPQSPNISSRDVFGVVNNGEDQGTVEFYVPLRTAQDFYYSLEQIPDVDLLADPDLRFIDINNMYVSEFLARRPQGIDGITALDGRTIIFTNNLSTAEGSGFQVTTQFDPLLRTAPDQIGASVSFDLQTRTAPNQVGANVSDFDSVPRQVADRIAQNVGFDATPYDAATRTEPNQISAMVSFDVTGEGFDEFPYQYETEVIVSGSPDPADGTYGSYQYVFEQTTGPVSPNDGEDGTYDVTPYDQRFEVIVSGSPDPADGAVGTFDVNGFNEPIIDVILSGEPDPLDGADGSYDSLPFDQITDINLLSQRYSVWRINYIYDNDGNPFMRLESVRDIPNLTRWRILYGTTYSSTQWYKNSAGYFERVPLLTATFDTLWYQDSTNPDIFGQIKLVDADQTVPVDLNEILGSQNYTSPNGVIFTNGLKVQFRGPTIPAQFQNQQYYVEGVGTGPGIDARIGFVDGEAYFGPWHLYRGQRMTGSAHDDTVFQQNIYATLEESLENYGAGGVPGAPLPQTSVFGAANGNGIRLVATNLLVTPETYTQSETVPFDSTPFDVTDFDSALNAPLIPDYIVQNRSDNSRNAWSRCNRWFHKDVINYSAQLNNIDVVINNDQRAKRPIIEFRADLRHYSFGTQAKPAVNIIDFVETDALSNINGQTGYGVDGYDFLDGSLVIFAADIDPLVRNRIYQVQFIDPDASGRLIIDLVPVLFGEAKVNQTVVCLNGNTQQGISFWFDGVTWQRSAQQKTRVNQAPLFDVFDQQGRSLGDITVYPSSTFAGSRLFGYAEGNTVVRDPVLGLSLRYLNIQNVGDIVFQNYLYTDTFIYVDGGRSITANVSDGFARQYIDRTQFSSQLGWQNAAAQNRSRQVFRFVAATDTPLILDVAIDQDSVYEPIQIFVEGVYVAPNQFVAEINTLGQTVITLDNPPPAGTVIEVQVISDSASSVAFYQIPLNLENNAVNSNSREFTLGSIRAHYDSIAQNLRGLVGPANGANNTRDLGNIIPYGSEIVQQSSPMLLNGVFFRKNIYDIFNAVEFNSREYQKYKTQLLDLASRGDYVNQTPTQVLDAVTQEISIRRNELFPFYWSDMLPAGETYTEINYVVTPISTQTFDVGRIYDFQSSNFQGLLVYLNGRILTRDYDYTVPVDTATIVISTELTVGDRIVIREYGTTYGSFVPNTPTKMGLYPAFRPVMYLDETYVEPTMVIRGHDGSITVAFGDYRDDVLLEFETRIFNNLKIQSTIPLEQYDVIPGQFRTTDYDQQEINNIISQDFLSWVGWNSLNYTEQTFVSNDAWTYNYSQSSDRLTGKPLLGAWRGIYLYFYDTLTPNTTPWEMLGFSEIPSWWQETYGPAPYTSGNLVLWQDLERGFIADPINPRVDARFVRPGLTKVIPADSEGRLLSPLEAVVGNYDSTSFQRSWRFGDDGPVESAWRTSSAWPFIVMRLLALTKPAEFFSLFVDRDQYVYDQDLRQYLWQGRYRLVPGNLAPLYGNGQSRASYINWIIDYNRQSGLDSTKLLETDLANLDVRLCWRLGAFSDKRYLKIFTERSTPSGTNTGLLLPDESYQLLLYKNPVSAQASYSSVVIQVVEDGYAVFGYNPVRNYFEIKQSRISGAKITIAAGGSSEQVPIEYSQQIRQVPYGFVFGNRAAVCDFLVSYGELLTERGFDFNTQQNGYIINWTQMAQEFLYWSNQGWSQGSIINLNPGANVLSITRPGLVVDSLLAPGQFNPILNQNRQVLTPANYNIDRIDNTLTLRTVDPGNTISFANFQFTAYENLLVLDNRSIFADLIYDPATAARQSRVLVSGWLSGDWNGTVNAPGFVLNQDNIPEWQPNRKYTKGDIVLFKDEYWSAARIVAPAAEFDYSVWIKSDYADVQKGLLPNAANASDQLANAYNVFGANLEDEVDLFAYGLIGFRPRQYMSALNLDDVSQVNLYQQFLATKGTTRAAEIFTFADLGKEAAEYSIYENWAMLRSVYGANANRSYFELLLDESLLRSDPSLVQVIEPEQVSQADQTIFVSDIWQSSYKINTPNILPTTFATFDDALPNAGYVDIEDVDYTVFDLTNSTELQNNINNIGVDTSIWVARVNTYDWNIYRAEKVPGSVARVSDNLQGQALVTFTQAHNLVIGDVLLIKYFNDDINGSYIVRNVPSIYTVIIDYEFTGFQTSVTGDGLPLTLQTSRVTQPSSISLLPYARQLLPGVRVWVDDIGSGRWGVLEKTDPFVETASLIPEDLIENSRFGAAVAQGLFNLTAIVGAPEYNPEELASAPGAVVTYVRTDQDIYEQNSLLLLTAANAAGYGNAIDVGDQTWSIIGASTSNDDRGYATTVFVPPGSNAFEQRQLLVNPNQNFGPNKFGSAVTMSQDERWMYISSPALNRVYAYTRIDVESQTVSYVSDGVGISYNWADHIIVDYTLPRQLLVVENNEILQYPTDYTVTPENVVLTSPATAGRTITIARKEAVQLDYNLAIGVASTTTGLGIGATFSVNNQRGIYAVTLDDGGESYVIGDVLTLDQDDIATNDATPPSPIVTAYVSDSATTITVASTTGIVPGMTVSGTGFDSGQFVESVISATDVVLNAAPDSTPSGNLTFSHDAKVIVTEVDLITGAVTAFTFTGQGITNTSVFFLDEYLATAVDIYAFTVRVNDVLQRPYIDYDFNSDSSYQQYDLVFNTVPPTGANIQVSAKSYFQFVDTISVDGLPEDANFGSKISTTTTGRQIMIGAPNMDNGAGRVYVFDRSVQRFTVTSTSENEFHTVRSLDDPGYITVRLNEVYLLPEDLNINGRYTVDITNPADPFVTVSGDLSVGDLVEVETNQFELQQILTSVSPQSNATFGAMLDQCVNDCSLYIASPRESSILEQAGSVEFYQQQARVYGIITTTVANPTLVSGDYIRINNVFVECTGTTLDDLVADIVDADIPNVSVSLLPDLTLEGDGVTKVFDVGTIYSSAGTVNTVVYVNDVLLTPGSQYTYDNSQEQITFVTAPPELAEILIVAGRITISVTNLDASVPLSRLTVLPGTGTLYNDLGFDAYIWQQTIVSPRPQAFANFGQGLFISDNTTTLMVGAPNGSQILACTFDRDSTTFDSDSTNFADSTSQSGVVYSFDALVSTPATAQNPLQFVFGQQFVNDALRPLDQFGAAIDYTTGVLLVGAPGSDLGDSATADFGKVLQFENRREIPAWQVIREQQPAVNIELLNTVFMYDQVTGGAKAYFDYFNPLQGKMLGVVQQNIDFIGAVDPAAYNRGSVNNYGSKWGSDYVGKIWWDVANVRFINPQQNDIVYASRRWGQLFPGSQVELYQWVASTVAPADYTGPGTPRDITSYVTTTDLDEQGFVTTLYYFWVTDLDTVAKSQGKTLSINVLTQYIENPRGSGIAYIAPLSASTVAIYNGSRYISAQDTVLHIEFDQQLNNDAVHVEYQIIPQDRADGFLTDTLYRKLLDSLSGADTAGNAVPDPFLSPSQRYGVQVRPRQSFFVNRFLALKNYLSRANLIMAQYPMIEIRRLSLLNSSEPEPSAASGAWDKRVLDREELSYQNLAEVPLGYRYLVVSDSRNNGLWTIYQVQSSNLPGGRILGLVRVQNYDTRQYWSRVDWYRPGFNPLSRVLYEVNNKAGLDTLGTVPVGSVVKVTSNGQGKWELYQWLDNTWQRVALQDGTIEFSATLWNYSLGRFGFDSEVFDAQYFDQAPVTETRKIIEAINQELLIDDLGIERNRLLVLMFNYILTEQRAPTWLTKTSLIDVDHVIRELIPFQVYRQDNQDFVLEYINEVKPYHTQIREFNLKYQGNDVFLGSLTDFDLPAFYDTQQQLFISPVLDNTGTLSRTSSVPSTSTLWQQFPYNQWYQNYLLNIESVNIINGGSGYTVPPTVIVTGEAERAAVMTAQINSAGRVVSVTVLDPGQGYSTTALITLDGGNGTGAEAVAVMGNQQIRNIVTALRYDRYQYQSTIADWQPDVVYNNGSLVRYLDRVWQANSQDSTAIVGTTFNPDQWTLVPANSLSGVDRTMGYYVPTPDQPGLDLAQLISGIDYPGVQVSAPTFNQNTGFDVGNYDINPFDNISFGADGRPTYDPSILDAIYESSFLDPFLGTRPADVNVDGGAFVDTFESHAPEELVPGITYDTLDLRVLTTPGADWQNDGHGSPSADRNYIFDSSAPGLDFAGLLAYPVALFVYNTNTGSQLNLGTDYTVDWVNYEVTVRANASDGDELHLVAYALGGGNQLIASTYVGSEISDRTVVLPMPEDLIDNMVIFVNGVRISNYTFEPDVPGYTRIEFVNSYTATDRVTVYALGGWNSSWSLPVTQYIISDGSLAYTLLNSMQGTNPANLIVNKNGVRARPPEGAEYISDGSSVEFDLPDRGGYDLSLVADNDVAVYVNTVPQILGVDFFVTPADGSSLRRIIFVTSPPAGSKILISVRTRAQYWVVGNQIVFQAGQGLIPVQGDVITITSWNDTALQDIVTQVFVGPSQRGLTVGEAYDTTLYDEGTVTGDPGTYDYSVGTAIYTNQFDTGRVIENPERLIVSLDGRYLINNDGFTVTGSIVNIIGPTINFAQTVYITSLTANLVPEAMAFRVFQDMRGTQTVYRMTPNTTTELTQPLSASADVIHVRDASNLSQPNLQQGLFGLITINGERIAYRQRDTANNTVSGLRRGTAGTGAASHDINSVVYDIGIGNLLPIQYQNREISDRFLADGSQTVFVASSIDLADLTGEEIALAVQVKVGGEIQTTGYTVTASDPVTVSFATAPLDGYQVQISVVQGDAWYQPGFDTASNGVPLQETNTLAARFLRGLS